jgi:hypothetical protein
MADDVTKVELVHRAILEEAAAIANRRAATEGIEPPQRRMAAGARFKAGRKRSGFVSGEVFRADPGRSRKGGLALSIEPALITGADQARISHLQQIARDAIKEALGRKGGLLVGLIIGERRAGRDYFERFRTDSIRPL